MLLIMVVDRTDPVDCRRSRSVNTTDRPADATIVVAVVVASLFRCCSFAAAAAVLISLSSIADADAIDPEL